MKRLLPAILAVSAAVTAGAAAVVTLGVRPPDARDVGAVRPAGSWGTAIEVPGLGALNTGGAAYVTSVSCGSAGSCAAGGNYRDRHGLQGFVAVERHGRWGRAIGVPGLAALNKGRFAELNSVSCGSAGSCAAGGDYRDRHYSQQGFVAVERNGRWGKAIEVPGLAALNTGQEALGGVLSVSCASAGNCVAGGDYDNRRGGQGFVAVERNGRWGRAIEVPGLGALNTGGYAEVSSVSCASPGSRGGPPASEHANRGRPRTGRSAAAWGVHNCYRPRRQHRRAQPDRRSVRSCGPESRPVHAARE